MNNKINIYDFESLMDYLDYENTYFHNDELASLLVDYDRALENVPYLEGNDIPYIVEWYTPLDLDKFNKNLDEFSKIVENEINIDEDIENMVDYIINYFWSTIEELGNGYYGCVGDIDNMIEWYIATKSVDNPKFNEFLNDYDTFINFREIIDRDTLCSDFVEINGKFYYEC